MRFVLPTFLVVAVLCGSWALWAQEAAPQVTLQYSPTVGDSEASDALGKLADIQMNGASLGITGQVTGKTSLVVVKTDADTQTFTLRATFKDMKGEFSGQPRDPKPIPPTDITLSKLGQVLKIVSAGDPEGKGSVAGLEALTGGGIPLDLVTMMATIVRFPETPVEVGGSWTDEEQRELPVVGKTQVTTVTKLVKIENTRAFLESTATAAIPPFEMDNPLMQGTKVKVISGKFGAEKIVREFDMARSMVVKSKGTFKIELEADMGFGFATPLGAVVEFDMHPPEPAPEAAEAQAGPAEAPTQPAPAAEPQAKAPGVVLGPFAAATGYSEGTASLRVGLDLSKVQVPAKLAKARPYINATRAAAGVGAGVAGGNAGKLSLDGQLQVGPLAVNRKLSVDLKQVALSIWSAGRDLVQGLRVAYQ